MSFLPPEQYAARSPVLSPGLQRYQETVQSETGRAFLRRMLLYSAVTKSDI